MKPGYEPKIWLQRYVFRNPKKGYPKGNGTRDARNAASPKKDGKRSHRKGEEPIEDGKIEERDEAVKMV